ncbi:type II toxin-antitoxin system mRNA interferase toxin, RelE/StbE family [Kiritimatiellaeota bacterium B1221]|nr:type II toxin-antitoxin system mRNA interferase toxin, RelE/StbE family [Kiritimatiellaeota bacterium B1221]
MIYQIRFSKKASKDVKKLTPKLQNKLKQILRNRIATDPYSGKALVGNLKGYYSVRLSYEGRMVYSIKDSELVLMIIRVKTHYGE